MLSLVRTTSAAFVAAALCSVGCASSSEEEGKPSRQIELRAEEYRFSPNEITARSGERLTVVLKNDGHKVHGLEFDLPGVNHAIPHSVEPGGTGRVTFIAPDRDGRYDFFSPVADDRKLGMEGKLVVAAHGTTR